MNGGIVTLLSDFGLQDAYVAAMKGVILTKAPGAALVDATHLIRPQDIRQAAWTINQYYALFPPGTIHLAVVDPGVGSSRGTLLAQADGQWLIGPDNGLFSLVMKHARNVACHLIRSGVHRPGTPSSTFHGRDIFAWVAGRLAAGTPVEELADPTEEYVRIDWPEPSEKGRTIRGCVLLADHFGNLVTNVHRDRLPPPGAITAIRIGRLHLRSLSRTYSDVPDGEPLALVASHNHLEIAVANGSAASVLKPGTHEAVEVSYA